MGRNITIKAPDGQFGAYVSQPANASRAPAVIVIQEIFGVNADLRETCDNFAAQGFLAVCPDLFWRIEPNVDLTDGSEAEWKKAFALYKAFDVDAGVGDIATTIAAARALPGASGKVGLVGFCLGGLLTYLTAARKGADAAVAYYGGGTDQHVDEARTLATPLQMHLGEEDEYISKQAREVIIAALKNRPKVEIYTYPGCNHAFARNGGKHFDAAAAALAGARTLAFLHAQLD